MSEFLSTAAPVLILVAAFAGLVLWARRDTFTGAQYRWPPTDTAVVDEEVAPRGNERTITSPRTATLLLS